MAEIFNKQFSSVFSTDDGVTPQVNDPGAPSIEKLIITSNGVRKLLEDLNPYKASGPDDVSARLLKECASVITDGLVLVFRASLHQGKIPDDWRHAFITPIHKGGNKNKTLAESYRPVSLTSVTCKVLEHIVHSHVISHLDNHNVLHDSQHGFRRKRSCETQLLKTVHDLAKTLNNKGQTDSVLLDFSKAFDKVCHRKLLFKLKHYGVNNSLHSWISDFLLNRTQRVVLRGVESTAANVKSGVPQGTVLGPLLFLIYINDMANAVTSDISLFADDALLYRNITNWEEASKLQCDLDSLVQWEQQWSMEFHPQKCKVLRITNKRKIIAAQYHIHNTDLETVEKAKYLGVTIDKHLSWNDHIKAITAKSQSCRHFLQRNLQQCDKETKIQCYKTFIRPVVEYASPVWDPVNNKSLQYRLEQVQRKSIRWSCNKWQQEIHPNNLLRENHLQTLQMRRRNNSLKMLFELYNGNKFLKPDMIPVRQRCIDVRFKPVYGAVQAYSNSFFPNTIQEWNRLPSNIANTKNLENFKKLLIVNME